MRVCGVTDIGRRRQENEDSYAVRELEGGGALLVVCDGMGGAQAGSVASSVAVEEFTAAVEEALSGGVPGDPALRERVLTDACRRANDRVYGLSREKPEYEGMGTTLVAALALPGAAHLVHVGTAGPMSWEIIPYARPQWTTPWCSCWWTGGRSPPTRPEYIPRRT